MTSTYTSAAEDAIKIRAALKAKGITSRQVSVKSDCFSGGSSITIKIKAPGISKKMVAEIANRHESIRRCEYSGDILSGSNRYVSVDIDYKLIDAAAAKFMPWLQSLEVTDSSLTEVPDMSDFYVGRRGEWQYRIFRNGIGVPSNSIHDVAQILAHYVVENA